MIDEFRNMGYTEEQCQELETLSMINDCGIADIDVHEAEKTLSDSMEKYRLHKDEVAAIIDDFYKVSSMDIANLPDAYDIQFIKFVQARKHKKRRINKKWLKQYGYKQIIVESKGWKVKTDTDGNIEFVK